MKLSKLDPMTALMLVVAFGVVITMLTQNSVASVDSASINANQVEQQTSAEMTVTDAQVEKKNPGMQVRSVSYDFPADAENGSATTLSKATFY